MWTYFILLHTSSDLEISVQYHANLYIGVATIKYANVRTFNAQLTYHVRPHFMGKITLVSRHTVG
jgi:hypothetical protein